MRALGIDVGEQRIGVAVSDPSGTISTPHGMVRRTDRAAAEIAALAGEVGAEVIVVGLPLKMRGGGEGPQAAAVRAFAAELAQQTTLPLEFYDERLTTVMAERSLLNSGFKRDQRKQQVDAVAAAIILQGWLDRRRLAAARAAEEDW
jgi:putative Holliday junction resolvase